MIEILPKTMFIIFLASIIRADIFEDIETANFEIEKGNIKDALSQLQAIYSRYPNSSLAQKTYLSFLYQMGQFNRVIENIISNEKIVKDHKGHIEDEEIDDILVKSKNGKNLMTSLNSNIEFLSKECPYSRIISKTNCTKLLRSKKFDECSEYLEQALIYFIDDREFEKIKYHLLVCKGDFIGGINGLKQLSENIGIIKKLEMLYHLYKRIEDELNDVYEKEKRTGRYFFEILEKIYGRLNNLLKDINPLMLEDSFQPSIFHYMKFLVLNEIVIVGIKLKIKGLRFKAKEVLKYKNSDTEKYNYFHSLLIDENIDLLENELNTIHFKSAKLKRNIEINVNILKEKKERDEEIERKRKKEKEEQEAQKREQQKRQQQRQQQQYNQRGSSDKKGKDYKEYYKRLGVDQKATKAEIKKKYRKLVKQKNPDKFKGKDEKKYRELSEEMMKINEAKSVLLDDDTRSKYDAGILDNDQRGGYQFNGGDFGDIFNVFFGGGGAQFSGSGGQSSGGGRRYYYSNSRSYF